MSVSQATFAAGCFWGVEFTFSQIVGVMDTEVGYTGGSSAQPTYQSVCRGEGDHAEAVRLTFYPQQIDYRALLEHFWNCHDPTQRDRQGPDIGRQYRSAIFTHDAQQAAWARASKAHKQQQWSKPIVTEIVEASTFWRAEAYHQGYLQKRQRL